MTEATVEGISHDPGILPPRTKGILIGSSESEAPPRRRHELRFTDLEYGYPDGLVVPRVRGPRVLMEATGGGVRWRTDLAVLLDRHLKDAAHDHKPMPEMSRLDPQELDRNEASRGFAAGRFETAPPKDGRAAA